MWYYNSIAFCILEVQPPLIPTSKTNPTKNMLPDAIGEGGLILLVVSGNFLKENQWLQVIL